MKTVYISDFTSPVGKITAAESDGGLVGLWIEGQKGINFPIGTKISNTDTPTLIYVRDWLKSYFTGERPNIDSLVLTPHGSDFQMKVWEILCSIPYGKTVTYKSIAEQMAIIRGKKKMSAQAVGGAVGANPISIIIPCHRVIGSDGSLTGYAGGTDIKAKLLHIEGIDI